MLSFEFSVFDLVLSLGVIVLIVLFVTTLWKLNPTNEKTHSQDEEAYDYEGEPTTFPTQPSRVDSWQDEGRSVPQKTQQAPKLVVSATAGGTSQEESLEQPQTPTEHAEPPKQTKTTTSQKQTPASFEAKDCLHEFGYLSGLPKNTPIPGECFGCQKIVDCLVTKKKK